MTRKGKEKNTYTDPSGDPGSAFRTAVGAPPETGEQHDEGYHVERRGDHRV